MTCWFTWYKPRPSTIQVLLCKAKKPNMSTAHVLCLILFGCILASLQGVADARLVCYGPLGCFHNKKPYNFALGRLPSLPLSVDTKFRLYTRRNPRGPGELIAETGDRLASRSVFDPKLPVKFIVHGFSTGKEPWMAEMKDALLQELPCNVILVNWVKGSRQPRYIRAVANTRLVGRQVSLLIRKLVRSGSSLDKVHLIGLSLGAHVCGFAGSELSGAIGRISGLDPAGPLFDKGDTKIRLDLGDARFVDIIHTNGVRLIKGGYGLTASAGHVDFYPNGGKWQPGCPTLGQAIAMNFGRPRKNKVSWDSGCHHTRSVALYTESINRKSCRFVAHSCPGGYKNYLAGKCSKCTPYGCSEMGFHADKYPARGDMYLTTGGSSPYCST